MSDTEEEISQVDAKNDDEVAKETPAGNLPDSNNDLPDKDLANLVTAEEYLLQKDVVLLEYEKQMFLDQIQADGLTVTSKGLYYDRVVLNILKVYSDVGNLVLVINSSEWEENYYKSKLDAKYVHEVANTAIERERVYLEGGIQFVSTRILVVDLLKMRVPVELITGIIVLRAHDIVESCQEAFALRLFRQRNKTGFIKAFSNSPETFTIGYGHIQRTMRNLFVKQLYIWPRFHATVRAALRPWQAQCIELHVPLCPRIVAIQTHILDIMNLLVQEIKGINRTVDVDAITVENCVTKKFHKILQAELDCIWHQLSTQTKLIVADLKILRSLIISNMHQDAVSAYAMMKRYRSTDYARNNSGWTLMDSAEELFVLSKKRVYNDQNEFEPDPCPKWEPLSELLTNDIPTDMRMRSGVNNLDPPKVLIICQDARTCFQLKQFLTEGGPRYLLQQAMRHEVPVGKLSEKFARDNQRSSMAESLDKDKEKDKDKDNELEKSKKKPLPTAAKAKEDEPVASASSGVDELAQLLADTEEDVQEQVFGESYMLTMTQTVSKEDPDENDSVFEVIPELEQFDVSAAVAAHRLPIVCLQSFKTERDGSMAVERALEQLKPHYVIMYNICVTALRQLEVFEARRRLPEDYRFKAYFLMHAQTVEEQSYLTSLRREKAAFEMIIDTKSKMVIPEYQDGKTDEAFVLYKSYEDEEPGTSEKTRQGAATGVALTAARTTPKVVVDMREFRSDLPCLIHKRGLEVMPVTIAVGDYILTPDICVERKSISDLIGSLNSGRLYNQCVQMQRHYAKPILLIEFDQQRSFHLQRKFMLSQQGTTSSNADIMQKLQLLTLHFPKLRIIWSPSPYATAQLFEEMKQGKPEPDPKVAASFGSEEAAGAPGEQFQFNTGIYDFLLRLPGVNTKNIHNLLRHGGSLKDLLNRSETELGELLQSQQSGKLLWNILHVSYAPDKDAFGNIPNTKRGGPTPHNRFRQGASDAKRGRR